MIKARILKRCGDPIGASQAMEEARALDLQDRFLNTKSAKYLLRDGQIEQANSVLGLFTKVSRNYTHPSPSQPGVFALPRKMLPAPEPTWKKCNLYCISWKKAMRTAV